MKSSSHQQCPRILFAIDLPGLNPRWGAAIHLLNLSQSLNAQGWDSEFFTRADCHAKESFSDGLSRFITTKRYRYDVIDFPCEYYDFEPNDLDSKTLWVARSFLLPHHWLNISLPKPLGNRLRSQIKRVITLGRSTPLPLDQEIARTNECFRKADIAHVLNRADVAALRRFNLPPKKIFQVPCGLTARNRDRLGAVNQNTNSPETLGFLGTYDYRKGGLDIPKIFAALLEEHPRSRLFLIGAEGLCQTPQHVLRFFPKALRTRISLTMAFNNEELPKLLGQFSFGVFPSYLEGSPLGVIEQLAAGIPVAAYRSPGTEDLLPDDWMVDPGDWRGLVRIISRWMADRGAELNTEEVRALGMRWTWDDIARLTDQRYREGIASKRY